MAEITTENLFARYFAGERDFSELDLSGIDLNISKISKYDPTKTEYVN